MENIENGIGNEIEAPSGEPHGEKPKRKMPLGKRITKETARTMALSSARAKKLRKDARNKMLQALCTQLDLGDELVKSVKEHDNEQVQLLEKAIKMVGLHFEQSEESAQNIKIDSKSEVNGKVDTKLELVFRDIEPSNT